ncbi:hypothetical protein AB0L82_17720 [Nocardia sp. NPDC052001]|uniref:hypothetical protein n=1 Tax=Nocardia sp. NPDC052001 TaxID=3154853 RepID=UPI0034462AC3
MNAIPGYIFDLATFDDDLSKIFDCIGFVPSCGCSNQEERALYGIAFLRGIDIYDAPLSATDALAALRDRSDILQKFSDIFPFVELPQM